MRSLVRFSGSIPPVRSGVPVTASCQGSQLWTTGSDLRWHRTLSVWGSS
ncbi:hypothetical protein ACFFX0_11025 [Citricoccus parietis]|uniref:Uncharacterized protein n=1 Tax=Citricoccus parietis TaxID=592307 RepID=A0ABV5FYD8_9MICC